MARRHGSREDAEINITPMLDIVFIMLIFFIVTTAFVKEAGVQVNKPVAASTTPKPQGNIHVAILSNDDVYMNKRRIELREVRTEIEKAHAENPEGSVVIIADQKARVGLVTQVMDQIKLGGVDKIAISALEPGGS